MEYIEIERESGQRLRLRYEWRSIRWLETQTGRSFQELFESLGSRATAEDLSWMVAAALYYENREVTIEDGDDVIEELGLAAAMTAVGEAIEHSSFMKGAAEALAKQNGTAPKNVTTGTSSRRQARGSA